MDLRFVGYAMNDAPKGGAVRVRTHDGVATAGAGCEITIGRKVYLDGSVERPMVYTSEFLPQLPFVAWFPRVCVNSVLIVVSPVWLPVLFVFSAIRTQQRWLTGDAYLWEVYK